MTTLVEAINWQRMMVQLARFRGVAITIHPLAPKPRRRNDVETCPVCGDALCKGSSASWCHGNYAKGADHYYEREHVPIGKVDCLALEFQVPRALYPAWIGFCRSQMSRLAGPANATRFDRPEVIP